MPALKFNLIAESTLRKLSGEDELQRLAAIKELESSIRKLADLNVMHAHYQEFIVFMNTFIDDANYEVRLASLKILLLFVERLHGHVSQCYKVSVETGEILRFNC